MKRIMTSLVAVSAIALGSVSLAANANEGAYIGIKSGVMDISIAAYEPSTPVGIQAGYAFRYGFAVEAEYTKTDFELGSGDGDITTFSAYGVYRTPGAFYGKFKAGILSERIKASNRFANVDVSDSGLSIGAGFGYQFTDSISAEAEYTLIEQDIGFFSAALNYHF